MCSSWATRVLSGTRKPERHLTTMAQNTYFRLKPIAVEAMRIGKAHDDIQRVIDWVNDNTFRFDAADSATWVISAYYGEVTVRTPEGEMVAKTGDWVVLLGGKFRTFTAEAFALMFEEA